MNDLSPDAAVWHPVPTCSRVTCGRRARWTVGSRRRSCDEHLSAVIADAYREAQLDVVPHVSGVTA